jgi:queuine tRNA-ribosyltransferase
MHFECLARDGSARRGRLQLRSGTVETPAFMPVGTLGTVKGLGARQLRELGTQMLCANSFHLMLRPGLDVITAHGGLHGFCGFRGCILTDSGGFQAMSLGATLTSDGTALRLRAPHDGTMVTLDPDTVMATQQVLRPDIAMVFDECTAYPADHATAAASMARSMQWAKRCREVMQDDGIALFGIIQGGIHADLRADSLHQLEPMGFEGLAIGGLAVGETATERLYVLDALSPQMPTHLPRYLMGVGRPMDILEAVLRGVDLFDCVIPSRHARNGQLFTMQGIVRIRNAINRTSLSPIEADCPCPACRDGLSLAFLHHLERTGDPLWVQLGTAHNVSFYMRLLGMIREAIVAGTLDKLHGHCLASLDQAVPVAY